MITVNGAYSFSEIGGKDTQEDRIFPDVSRAASGQKYFILCDGMGGHECGEVASEAVSCALGRYFNENPVPSVDEEYFFKALSYAYDQLNLEDNGSEKKMGTTMTCLYFNQSGFLAAHIGDSRIYQFRKGKIIFKTRDHSLVNDLLKAGEITEEEARNYPRKNVITRAMQPNAKRQKADVYESLDVKPGDYFLMCCDGVLERNTDEMLMKVMGDGSPAEKKIAAIKAECDKGTRDNYTCWLIEVGNPESEPVNTKGEKPVKKDASSSPFRKLIVPAVALAISFAAGALAMSNMRNVDNERNNGMIDSLSNELKLLKSSNESLKERVKEYEEYIELQLQQAEDIKENISK